MDQDATWYVGTVLGPGNIMLVEDQLRPQKGGGTQQPSTFWPRYCIQTAGWIKVPLGVEVGLGPDHILLGGDPAPPSLPQKQDTPNFWRMSVVDKRLYGSTRHNTVFTRGDRRGDRSHHHHRHQGKEKYVVIHEHK